MDKAQWLKGWVMKGETGETGDVWPFPLVQPESIAPPTYQIEMEE